MPWASSTWHGRLPVPLQGPWERPVWRGAVPYPPCLSWSSGLSAELGLGLFGVPASAGPQAGTQKAANHHGVPPRSRSTQGSAGVNLGFSRVTSKPDSDESNSGHAVPASFLPSVLETLEAARLSTAPEKLPVLSWPLGPGWEHPRRAISGHEMVHVPL